MSTYDATVSILKELTEEELTAVHDLVVRIRKKKNQAPPFEPFDEEKLLAELALADEDVKNGNVVKAEDASLFLREKYAL